MEIITYKFSDGQVENIEIPPDHIDAISEIEKDSIREKWRNEWRQRKHLSSLEDMQELGCQFRATSQTPEELLIEKEERISSRKALKSALSSLSLDQRLLLRKIYIDNKSLKEIAKSENVTYQAIQNRHKKILRKLRKFFD